MKSCLYRKNQLIIMNRHVGENCNSRTSTTNKRSRLETEENCKKVKTDDIVLYLNNSCHKELEAPTKTHTSEYFNRLPNMYCNKITGNEVKFIKHEAESQDHCSSEDSLRSPLQEINRDTIGLVKKCVDGSNSLQLKQSNKTDAEEFEELWDNWDLDSCFEAINLNFPDSQTVMNKHRNYFEKEKINNKNQTEMDDEILSLLRDFKNDLFAKQASDREHEENIQIRFVNSSPQRKSPEQKSLNENVFNANNLGSCMIDKESELKKLFSNHKPNEFSDDEYISQMFERRHSSSEEDFAEFPILFRNSQLYNDKNRSFLKYHNKYKEKSTKVQTFKNKLRSVQKSEGTQFTNDAEIVSESRVNCLNIGNLLDEHEELFENIVGNFSQMNKVITFSNTNALDLNNGVECIKHQNESNFTQKYEESLQSNRGYSPLKTIDKEDNFIESSSQTKNREKQISNRNASYKGKSSQLSKHANISNPKQNNVEDSSPFRGFDTLLNEDGDIFVNFVCNLSQTNEKGLALPDLKKQQNIQNVQKSSENSQEFKRFDNLLNVDEDVFENFVRNLSQTKDKEVNISDRNSFLSESPDWMENLKEHSLPKDAVYSQELGGFNMLLNEDCDVFHNFVRNLSQASDKGIAISNGGALDTGKSPLWPEHQNKRNTTPKINETSQPFKTTSFIIDDKSQETAHVDYWYQNLTLQSENNSQTATNSQELSNAESSQLLKLIEESSKSQKSHVDDHLHLVSDLFFNDFESSDNVKEKIFEDKFVESILGKISGKIEGTHFADNMDALLLNMIDNSTSKIDCEKNEELPPPDALIWDKSRDTDDALSTGSNENLTETEKRLREGFNRISKDKSLLLVNGSNEPPLQPHVRKIIIINKIMAVFLKIIDDIRQERSPTFQIRELTWTNCTINNDKVVLKSHSEAKYSTIAYKSKNSKINFKLMLYLLIKIGNFLNNNSTCTRREIYYQLLKYVKSESRVYRVINLLSCMLDEPPWNFGIFATNKGLVYGDLNIFMSADEVIRCNVSGGSLIPQDINKIIKIESNAYFILIVEKDAVFQKLLDEDLPNRLTRPFIMITGKGSPDMNTRLFVKKLWRIMSIPVFILVDADPFGFEIMLTYRFGSLTMAHLNDHLAIPNLRWIGVHPSDILNLNISCQPLTGKDVAKIHSILKRPYMSAHPRLRDELQLLLNRKVKAEIEGLIKSENFLRDFYLPGKFYTQDYI